MDIAESARELGSQKGETVFLVFFLSLNSISNESRFLVSFSISFLDGDTVNVVISAEWYDFEVGSDIVDNASADTVNVKVV